MDANGENKESVKQFTGKETWYRPSWPQIQGDLTTLGPETKEAATELLLRYAPKLRDDSGEAFREMSWKPITETYTGTKAKDSNALIRSVAEKSAVVAYANPALSTPNLNWEFLKPPGGKYPNEKLVNGGDRLSERSNSEKTAFEDIAFKQVEPQYKERAYGRVKYDGGRWWLQYWLWSYYQSYLPKMFGDHEGDWEMIQIALNESGLPELATYAQHTGGESCEWEELPTSIGYYGNLAPDVFVSWGVHASYTSAGAVPSPEFTDAEIPIPARVESMSDTENWVQWPGTWGDSESSPGAPSTQGAKWSEPAKFYEEADECGASLLRGNSAMQKAQKSPAPELGAEREGDDVRVTYHWSANVRPSPRSILVSISEPGGFPFSRNILVHGNSGQVKIGNPFDGDELVARLRTIAPGVQSEPAEAPVR